MTSPHRPPLEPVKRLPCPITRALSATLLMITLLLWSAPLRAQPTTTAPPPLQDERAEAAEAPSADPMPSAITLSQRIARVATLNALEAQRASQLQARGLQAARAAGAIEALRAAPTARRVRERLTQSLTLASASARAARADALVEEARAAGALVDVERASLLEAIATQRDRQQRDAERRAEAEARQRAEAEARQRAEEERQRNAQLQQRAEAERDDVIARQRLAQTNQLKALLSDQLKLADQVVALTRRLPEREAALRQLLTQERQSFTAQRDALRVALDAIPEAPRQDDEQAQIDARFEEVRLKRRRAREVYPQARLALATTAADVARFERELATSQARLEEALSDKTREGEEASEIGKARVDSIRTRLRKLTLERDLAALERAHAEQIAALIDEQLLVYDAALELLLTRISDAKRDDFYALAKDQNWHDAQLGLQLGADRFSRHVRARLSQALTVPERLTTLNAWGWLLGFVIRLALVIALLRYVRRHGERHARALTERLLRRNFFSERAPFTVKLGELLRYLIIPTTRFIAITVMLRYSGTLLPELRFVQWIVNAAFTFSITTTIVSVLVLPRALRSSSAAFEGNIDLNDVSAHSPDGVDLFALELRRARKLVLSAKLIIWFVLLTLYLPGALVAFMGRSVVWRVVDLGAKWFLAIIVYTVLSTWRDDIAHLFERLASERLPRAVTFVNENKDRLWGVLVIGGASLYVIARESARLGRRYVLETSWSKQLSNFVFRKKIELQQRDRSRAQTELTEVAMMRAIPARYLAPFTDHSLDDEPYRVLREGPVQQTLDKLDGWGSTLRQGSVALIGETGTGKTTTLLQLDRALRARESAPLVVAASCADKALTQTDALTMIARLFDLAPTSDRASLIRAVLALPTQHILLDDCQNLFIRRIGGFDALECFLDIVNLTDSQHFWVLSFNRFAWHYINRVRPRQHYFGAAVMVPAWGEAEIEALISQRHLMTGREVNYTDLVITRPQSANDDFNYEVIKSARGYFRLLHDFSQGNPRVALTYWLRSLKFPESDDAPIQVGLFRQPPVRVSQSMPDNYWFALTAIAQHGCLSAREVALVVNAEVGFCEAALNYFKEMEVVTMDARGRARLTPLYFRQVLRQLTDSNYLYG